MEPCQGCCRLCIQNACKVQGPGPEPSKGGRQKLSSILPVLVCRLRLPSLLIPPTNCLGRSPRVPPRHHAMRPNGSCGDTIHCVLLLFVDTVLHGAQTSRLECLLKWGTDPTTACASVGHHVRHSSICPVMEALQHIPHVTSHSPRFTAKEHHSLHHSLAKHAKDLRVSTFSCEKLAKRARMVQRWQCALCFRFCNDIDL